MLSTDQQIDACLHLLNRIMKDDLMGVYLFGSALLGGLQKYSDLDLFVVIKRPTTQEEKRILVTHLLQISGIYMKSDTIPIEMTLVVQADINPWQYPPHFDFQYGEWLREAFESGNIEPWQTKTMPDLALMITQILLSSKILFGTGASKLLTKIPYSDVIRAMADGLSGLMDNLETDTRNVLLTLARIWTTLETNSICSKPAAADWVIPRLPKPYQTVLQRAKAICMGTENEHWEDLNGLIHSCACFVLSKINEKIATYSLSNINESIKIMDNNRMQL